jgi:hypothetical protein
MTSNENFAMMRNPSTYEDELNEKERSQLM